MAENDKKVMDVANAKEAKVEIGAKPMIVGHKSMAGDPMVREEAENLNTKVQENTEPVSQPVAPPSEKQKTIEPLNNQLKETPATEDTAKESLDKPVDSKSDNETTDNKTEEENTKDKIDPAAEAMEKEEALRKIIESKKYNVSIKQSKGSKKGLVWLLVGLFIALLFGLFYLVDTDKLDLGFDLPVNVFGTEEKTQQTTTAEQVVTENEETTNDKQPWKTFEFEELGLTFEYPEEWIPEITKTDEDFTAEGTAYIFDLLPVKFGGYIFSEDWKASDTNQTYSDNLKFEPCKINESTKVEVEYLSVEGACIIASDYTFIVEEGDQKYPDKEGEAVTESILQYQREISADGVKYSIEISTAPLADGNIDNMKKAYDEIAENLKKLDASIKLN